MLKFKQFIELQEGGGVLKTDEGQTSSPIDTSTPEKRKAMRASVAKTLSAIHDHFKQNHQTDIFSDRLVTGTAYSGSSKHLMDKKISNEEFAKHKSSIGDIDVKISHDHRDIVSQGLRHNQTFGDHTILKVHRRGEVHVLARHNPTGAVHQIDFEPVKEPDHPFTDFSRSSSWEDSKTHPDIKGAHHKMLLNAAGGETHKFGTKGLVSRTNESDVTRDPKQISHKLFGPDADYTRLSSFVGVTSLIKKHVPAERHQAIIDKVAKSAGEDHPATRYLRKHLSGTINEQRETEHHVAGFFGGVDPHTHVGHVTDMKNLYSQTPAKKMVFGMSQKGTSVFNDDEKKSIVKRQWGSNDIHPTVTKSMGSMAREAHDALPEGKKVLHLLVGADREEMGKNFIHSLESGKIPEMEGKSFHRIHLHVASGDRSHGLSGTKMRTAVANGDEETYGKHLGSNFSSSERKTYMSKIKNGLDKGKLKVKRR